MASNLITPQCEVFWGSDNLTAYPIPGMTQPQPLVFDVSVSLQDTGSTPNGSFKWNPTGPAMEIYEKFVSNPAKMKEQIVIRFFYPGGKSISFAFVWSGQTVNFGVSMGVTVKIRSELDGLVNANLRSIAQAYDETTSLQSAVSKLEEQFGLGGKSLVKYTTQATTDLGKAKVENAYATDIVFATALTSMVKANGNSIFASNIGEASMVVFTPYSWEKSPQVINAVAGTQDNPDPSKRYGYILGPAIIEDLERSSEWQPPQQTNVNTTVKRPIPSAPASAAEPSGTQNPTTAPEANAQENAQQVTSSPSNTSKNLITATMRMTENEDGPVKQELLNKEKQAKLTANMFMCPVLTGIKPHDIVFVPSLTGKYIEDWIVSSVTYQQSAGKINVSVQATRTYGLGNPMQPTVAQQFQSFAAGKQMVGPGADVKAWEQYAWPIAAI
jgi:hypothetical protein